MNQMMSFRKTPLLFPVLLLSITQCGVGQEEVGRENGVQESEIGYQSLVGLEEYVEQLMEDWQVPGVAVGVISMENSEAPYMRGFGYREVERGLPVTPRTVFSIGSCAKAFTAAAMAALVSDGALEWDTPLHEAVPAFRLYDDESTSQATPMDILVQRTGLAGYEMLQQLPTTGREGLWDRVSGLEPAAGFRERFQYSNLSFLMAGRIVEEVAGEPYEAFVRRRILQPVGMESTTLSYLEAQKGEDVAVPYLNFWVAGEGSGFGDGFFRSEDFEDLDPSREELSAPSGGVYSSLEDMMKWVALHLNQGQVAGEAVLSEETMRAMHTTQADIQSYSDDEEMTYLSYGMGWFVQDYRGYAMVQHDGQVYGYMARVSFLPEEGIGVVVLTNAYYHHLHHLLTKNILDRLLGLEIPDRSDALEAWLPVAESMSQQAREFWDTRPENAGPPTRPLEEYSGTFSNPLYGTISVGTAGESLEVTFRDRVDLELRHFSDDTFATESGRLDFYPRKFLRFQVGPDGRVEGVRISLDEWEDEVLFTKS